MVLQQLTEKYNTELAGKSIVEKLKYLVENHSGKVVFTTSFGYEDQVITDLIFSNNIDIKVVTLDNSSSRFWIFAIL